MLETTGLGNALWKAGSPGTSGTEPGSLLHGRKPPVPTAATFVRSASSASSGTSVAEARDRGRLPGGIANDISEFLEAGNRALAPGGSMPVDFGGKPMVLSRAATGHGIALQTRQDFEAGNGLGCFCSRDADDNPTLALDSQDIAFGNPLLRKAYSEVQALLLHIRNNQPPSPSSPSSPSLITHI